MGIEARSIRVEHVRRVFRSMQARGQRGKERDVLLRRQEPRAQPQCLAARASCLRRSSTALNSGPALPVPQARKRSTAVPDQSRSRSLIPVLERVCASTVLTMTAQERLGPGVPSGSGLPGSDPGTTTE